MSFEISDLFPNISQGLSNIGFLFGAGTSAKAGYPMMPELTIQVLNGLGAEMVAVLDDLVLRSSGKSIDRATGDPNIEIISDVLEAAILTADTTQPNYIDMLDLRNALRQRIVDVFLDVKSPLLDDHIRFFRALSRLLSGRPEPVWIFTPNYDLLFELASAIVKLSILDGFLGASFRFFNVNSLLLYNGTLNGHFFQPFSQPTVRLVKLHGSLDWWKQNGSVYSTQISDQLGSAPERVIVLPRKRKITETLDLPFDDLFRVASRILGSGCKYLVSCGYGYSDQHINEALLLPKLRQSKIQLTALVKEDTPNLDPFKILPPFAFGTESIRRKRNGPVENTGTDLWQFDKFVDLLASSAGF